MKKLLFILPILLLVGCGNAQATNNSDVVEETKKVVESTTKAPETTKVVETTIVNESAKKENILSAELTAIKDEMSKMSGREVLDKYGTKTGEYYNELANAGYYLWAENFDKDKIQFLNKDEVSKKIQSLLDGEIGEWVSTEPTKKIYEELKDKKLANDAKVEQQNISALVVRLQSPKTVDQIGGNKVGDNAGMYKGQIQQPRKYGTTPYLGSGLFACNSLLGENAENFYECRNGFVVLKSDGFAIYDKLKGKDRGQFSKTEWEVFKINNPNIKVIKSGTNEYYNQKFEYGTFADNGEPMWLEGYNQCVVDYLGNNWFQSGTIIDGQLLTKEWHPNKGTWVDASYSNGCSHPNCCDSVGNVNKNYSDEMYLANTVEERNAVARKYMK